MYVKFDIGYFIRICLVKFSSYRALYVMAKVRFIVAGHINPFVTGRTYSSPVQLLFSSLGTSGSHFSMLPTTVKFLYSVKTHCWSHSDSDQTVVVMNVVCVTFWCEKLW